ncbi:TPA: hypothetical protein L6A21_32805 [Pseudomonas aeruginosa]|nr:hypothetical protein [Pseudomonas aeruginosa]HBP6781562.1 hypothetical protein [Pseudomonas aeruginosa]
MCNTYDYFNLNRRYLPEIRLTLSVRHQTERHAVACIAMQRVKIYQARFRRFSGWFVAGFIP